jgi:UDP-2,3-diacylglucosamine pyrophosphatase LpxH
MTNPLCSALTASGLAVRELTQDGVPLRLTWDVAETGPILGNRCLFVVPDMHLGAGGPGDIFIAKSVNAKANMMDLLRRVAAARGALDGRTLTTLQLGDLYDVWRADPAHEDHPDSRYDMIEVPYGELIELFLSLDVRVCVGNHDASLALYPPAWARDAAGQPNGRLGYAQLASGGQVLAFHGHQVDQLSDAMAAQGGASLVKLATLAAKLDNALATSIERDLDIAGDFFGDRSTLQEIAEGRWPLSTVIEDEQGFSATRWCDRTGPVAAIVNRLKAAATVRLVFVGHSHRAGITAIHVGGRFVPVIDAGSWVWGNTHFAVAVEGEISLWELA